MMRLEAGDLVEIIARPGIFWMGPSRVGEHAVVTDAQLSSRTGVALDNGTLMVRSECLRLLVGFRRLAG